jgi:diguanylate cyclase (GGDEF)-like protein
MKLTKKLMWPITAAFLTAAVLFICVYRATVITTFSNMEIKRAQASSQRVANLLEAKADNLQTKAMDYARWDSTYEYIADPDKAYITSAFSDYSAFIKLGVNQIAISDLAGNVVFLKELDCSSSQVMGSEGMAALSKNLLALMKSENRESVKGILKTGNGPMLIACEKVFDGGAGQATNGVFILAKYLDQEELSDISYILGTDFKMEPYDAGLYKDAELKPVGLAFIKNSGSDYITSYMPMVDVLGTPAYTIEITQAKDLMGEFNSGIDIFLIFLVAAFLLFTLTLLKYLDVFVLKRLAYIKGMVAKIRATRNLSLRLEHDCSDDEISELGRDFNSMFDTLQQSNRKLADSEKKYSSLFDHMLSSFMYCRVMLDHHSNLEDYMILESNNAMEGIVGVKGDQFRCRPASEILPAEFGKGSRFMKMIEAVAVKGCAPMTEDLYITKHDRWLNLSIYSTAKDHFAVTMSDITNMKKYEQQIAHLAYYDELTNLPNRKKLLRNIQSLIDNRKCSFALLFADLDNFKSINDSLGHDVGDYVLTQASDRLSRLADENIILGRLGGDEFIVVIKELASRSHAEAFASRMLAVTSPPIRYKEHDLYLGASIGISCYPEDGSDLSTLMRNADTAMYEAKRKGGYCSLSYSKQMNDTALAELLLEGRLKNALASNELRIFYQPITDLMTMNPIGYEALSRWELDGRLLSPAEFIPVAKSIGEIPKIDNWVLRNACAQCKTWQETSGIRLSVSVNISFKQLKEQDFFQSVMDALDFSGLDPGCLKLEITEDEAMEHVDLTLEVLSKLRAVGITICLDDFGTGYSSLSYMNKLPIDTLKVDMTLISTIDKNFKTLEIVRSIVTMAQTLGIRVTAEGVERESQLDLLRWMGCNAVQGYLISKPKPPEEFYKK